ncbi:glycosyltransferase family 4 protein [Vagococcus lutrae]|uniref:glycosyltransferase family 4 protein n=1 Tax=Vagococcus lutrae TaxID=81947 RepID=UPI0020983D84|nr:glycosyltransferase family 4 protein [Vagococcus lutrae]MCO7150877.1 glycosyltransferase family 4 protein [Vagococcus lutrae]
MKVLQLCSYYKDSFYSLLFQELEKIDIQNDIFFPYNSKKNYRYEMKNIYSAPIYTNSDRIFYRKKQFKYNKFINDSIVDISSYDLIHAHTLFSDGFMALKLKEKFKIPYIVAVRSTDINTFFRYRKDLRNIGKKILSEANKIIVLSDNSKRYIEGEFKDLDFSTKLVIIPNGVNNMFIENKYDGGKNIRDTIKILTVGEVSKRKNQKAVVKACDILINKGYIIDYSIVGKIKSPKIGMYLKSKKYISMYGYLTQKELIDIYRENHIFVLPSITETFGISYLESISQNTPVIYTRGQGFDKLFMEKEVGCSVDANRPDEIAKKIEIIIENIQKFSNLSNRVTKYSWNEIAIKYKTIYESIS